MSLGKIKIGTAFNKSYTHNMDFDNNTTMDFGTVQPLLCQYLFPRSDVKVNYRQLIRLAPMPTPSFARLFAKNYVRFVPISDVVPYHEAFLSKKPYFSDNKSFIPRKMPYTSNRVLMWKLLWKSHWTIYYRDPKKGGYSEGRPGSDDWNNIVVELLRAFHRYAIGSSEPTIDTARLQSSQYVHTSYAITFEESDYIIPIYVSSATANARPDGFICFKFSDAMKRLRKQLVGLGYSLTFDDNTPVSLVPMLAYYKAYFDTFGLTRVRAFESTNCYSLVRKIADYEYAYDLSLIANQKLTTNPKNTASYFDDFVYEFSNLFFTDSNNFLAAHRESPNNDVLSPFNSVSSFLEANGNSLNEVKNITSDRKQVTAVTRTLGSDFSGGFTQLTLDVLKRVTRFVAKDSAIGYRISDWVRVHYGADVVNSLFEESNFISSSTTPIDISDVFSTSDTADIATEKKGDYLGAYAGKGIGFNKNGFSFHSRYHGYLFMFSCIVPQIRDFVGCDPTLYAIDTDAVPVPDFDALGMELTPRGAVVGDNFISSFNEFTDKSFGFVPRYSGFKVKKDVVNGDMYLGYYKRDLQPYYLNRIPYNNYMNSTRELRVNMSPNASTAWQVLDGNTSVGNFNRLFYDEGNPFADYDNPDNFIVQTVFDFKVKNFLKPISESYETFDDTNDNKTTNVSAN